MAIDLTGGLDDSREHVFAERPEHPEMRDAVNMWVSDDRGVLGLPRFAVEALASKWDAHDLSVNIAFPERPRLQRARQRTDASARWDRRSTPPSSARARLCFAASSRFVLWTTSFKGDGRGDDDADQINGALPAKGPPVDVEFRDRNDAWRCRRGFRDSSPPMLLRSSNQASKEISWAAIATSNCSAPRARCASAARFTHFTGSGLRIRRQGIRKIEGFWGHCWQSALFPSGRGFGYIAYPPRPDGSPSYNEGYIFEGDGALIPARVVQAPWLRKLQHNQDVTVVLESKRGRITIEGETILAHFRHGPPRNAARLPGAAAGGRALSLGRRGDVRNDRAFIAQGQDHALMTRAVHSHETRTVTPADMLLTDQVAVVTGGGGGIGRAIALAYASVGANVVIGDIVPERCEETAARVREMGRQALAVPTDVTDTNQVRALIDSAEQSLRTHRHSRQQCGGVSPKPFLDQSERSWRRHIDLNLVSMLAATSAAVPIMIRGGRGGSIINVEQHRRLRAQRPATPSTPRARRACSTSRARWRWNSAITASASTPSRPTTPSHPACAAISRDRSIPQPGSSRRPNRRPPRRDAFRSAAPASTPNAAMSPSFCASRMSEYVTGIVLPVDGGIVGLERLAAQQSR